MAKQITIIRYRIIDENRFTGTVDELVENVFGRTLECGHFANQKIARFPKTAKSLVNALNKSAQACGRYHDCYVLKSE